MPKKSKPNFLFLITDQQRHDHLGFKGVCPVKTPHIDSLAARGTVFSQNYVTSPTCMSNRATFMTGRTPNLNGVRYNGVPLDVESVTFVDLLRAQGWQTALIGKSHLQGMSAEDSHVPRETHGTHLLAPPESLSEAKPLRGQSDHYQAEIGTLWQQDPNGGPSVHLPYYGFDKVLFATGHGDMVSGHYEGWLHENYPEQVSKRGIKYRIDDQSSNAPQTYQTALDEAAYPTSWIKGETLAYLREQADSDQPFFLQCSFPDPHHPFCPPGRYFDLYDVQDITLPASFYHSSHDQIPPIRHLWTEFSEQVKNKRWTFPFITDERQAKQMVAKTLGQITMIDDAIGEILSALEETGLTENTVVVFMSDHGDHMGEHGLFLKGPFHSQGVIRTPLIWVEPDQEKPREITSLTSTIDMARTILERAGLAPANGMHGHSLMPLIEGRSEAIRKSVLVEQATQFTNYLGIEDIKQIHSIITDDWRLTVWQGERWGELYHISHDPEELTNLWDNADYQTQKQDLLMQLVHALQNHSETSPHPISVS